MSSAFQLTIDEEGIGDLLFDLPGEKVNKLNFTTLEELDKKIQEASESKSIKVLIIRSGKETSFIAGADLHIFLELFDRPDQAEELISMGHRVFNNIQNLPFPTIALIHGACLGGGMELALACTYRIATDSPKTTLGLPEVNLGIFPGWGGTQRMPRLVGLIEGVPLVISGKPVPAKKALKIHLIDSLLPFEFIQEKSKEFARNVLTKEGRAKILQNRARNGIKHWFIEKNPLGRAFLFHQAEKETLKKTKGHYPAPLAALKLIKETAKVSLKEGLEKERRTLLQNMKQTFSNAPNLIRLFFTQESLKKETETLQSSASHPIQRAAVLGAGTMGSGIAWLLSNFDYSVRCKDIDWNALAKGFGNVHFIYNQLIKIKKLTRAQTSLKFHKITGTVDYSGFKNVDIVFEAAVENIELKQKIFKDLEAEIPPNTIIASNTSSLTVSEMGKFLKNPERFLAMHFFNPVNKMPLVEVVAGPKTSPDAISIAVDLCRKLGKTPLVVKDCPGFLVNRIFMVGAQEILWMYQEGVSMEALEKMMEDFGMPMSPFILSDEVGNDVAFKVGKTFEQAYGERMNVPKILEAMVDNKLLGKKTGKGFYIYSEKNKKPNPYAKTILRDVNGGAQSSLSSVEIRDRVILGMANEAARCLQEKIIENPAYLDLALIMGVGFPPFRGGLLNYVDELGISYVVNRLKMFDEKYGRRFSPCELLLEMENKQRKFFS